MHSTLPAASSHARSRPHLKSARSLRFTPQARFFPLRSVKCRYLKECCNEFFINQCEISQLTDSKDCKMLSTEAQVRYLVQWFQEWSDLQRSDFLPILAEKYANKAYVNGIVNSIANVNCQDKPMSLFECRVKLFKEWFSQWSAEQKEAFLKQISDIDSSFAEKLNAELQNGVPGDNHETNGNEILED